MVESNANLPRVSDNHEKSTAYKEAIGKYKQAIRSGFYLEAIFIDYAIFEDRLSSFLYYAGALQSQRIKLTTNNKVKPFLTSLLSRGSLHRYDLKKISHKIQVVKLLLQFCLNEIPVESDGAYQVEIYKQIQKCSGAYTVLYSLPTISDWCQMRNELVHGLLNHNSGYLDPVLEGVADEGYVLGRQLDNFVKSFKIKNNIRLKFNIQ
jgi:hypothetical protein